MGASQREEKRGAGGPRGVAAAPAVLVLKFFPSAHKVKKRATMPTDLWDIESFLLRNKRDIGSILLALMCIPATSAAAMAVVLLMPLCALFVTVAGLLFARLGIIAAPLFPLVFLAGTVVVGLAGLF
jgi:hypothetical protein